jgi:hypothetical protein
LGALSHAQATLDHLEDVVPQDYFVVMTAASSVAQVVAALPDTSAHLDHHSPLKERLWVLVQTALVLAALARHL